MAQEAVYKHQEFLKKTGGTVTQARLEAYIEKISKEENYTESKLEDAKNAVLFYVDFANKLSASNLIDQRDNFSYSKIVEACTSSASEYYHEMDRKETKVLNACRKLLDNTEFLKDMFGGDNPKYWNGTLEETQVMSILGTLKSHFNTKGSIQPKDKQHLIEKYKKFWEKYNPTQIEKELREAKEKMSEMNSTLKKVKLFLEFDKKFTKNVDQLMMQIKLFRNDTHMKSLKKNPLLNDCEEYLESFEKTNPLEDVIKVIGIDSHAVETG